VNVAITPGTWAGAAGVSRRWVLDGVTVLGLKDPFKIPYGYAGKTLQVFERAWGGSYSAAEAASNIVTIGAGVAPRFVELGTKPSYKQMVLSDRPAIYYTLGEAGGTVAVDETGRWNGTYAGNPVFGTGGIVAGTTCVLFDGVDDRLDLPSAYVFQAGASITLEWWAYLGSPRQCNLFSSTVELNLHAPWSDGNTYWDYGAGYPAGRLVVGYPQPTGGWYHMCVTFDAATGRRTIMHNGIEAAVLVDPLPMPNNHPGGSIATGPNGFWNGYLQHFAIYNYALPPARAVAHFAARDIPANPAAPKWVPLENIGATPATPKWVPIHDV